MAITKPATYPRWGEVAGSQGVVGPNESAPNSGQQDSGFVPATEPPAQWFNFLFRYNYDWIQYLGQAFFTADAGSGNPGASGTGDGTGPGFLGTGSTAGSRGGRFVGTGNNPGVRGEGGGNDAGGDFIGGPTGPGARAVPGGGATPARGALAIPAQVTPTAPTDGDGWYDGTGLFWRIGVATKQILLTVAGIISRSQLPAVGQQVSTSSSSFSTTSASFVDVTNLAVTITTSGRPVMLMVQSDGTPIGTAIGPILDSTVSGGGAVQLTRAGTRIAGLLVPNVIGSMGLSFLDTPAAGTYTYKIQAKGDGTQGTNVNNVVLVAYEL